MAPKPRATKRVTIQQVAHAAGVDRSTVSRVFNNPDILLEETVRRVKDVALKLGYSPNSAARALRTGRNSNIALIVPDLTNPFMPPIALAVQKEAAKRGFAVFIGNADENPSQEVDLLNRLADQVAGAILASPRSASQQIHDLARDTPLVLINRDIEGVPRVLIDSGQGMAQAVAHLAGLGHRHITYAGGPDNSWSNDQRHQAVTRAAAAHGLTLSTLSAGTASFARGAEIVPQLLALGATACIAFDDVLAHGICSGLVDNGLSNPADYSVVGCDDILGYPMLTTVSGPSAQAGQKAVEMLASSLGAPPEGDLRVVLETELVIRQTVCAPGRG
ncbi:LacI family DNA-binding transcriptional regulator [Marinovum algicola]|jgi:LacI family transcriptional regulator|uniref:LacI family DNA-binding transcriptional regulator n=1 Tax=Marinovum algicola TaxID=42444 RepID=UPI0024BB9754|nr:LacI family DNA-binding transcriptional regulator [Marinovum algicola]